MSVLCCRFLLRLGVWRGGEFGGCCLDYVLWFFFWKDRNISLG